MAASAEVDALVQAYLRNRDKKPIHAAAPELRAEVAVVLFEQIKANYALDTEPGLLVAALFRQELPFSTDQAVRVMVRLVSVLSAQHCPVEAAVEMVERVLAEHGRHAAVIDALERLDEILEDSGSKEFGGALRRAHARVERLLDDTPRGLPEGGDRWGDAARAQFEALPDKRPWQALYQYAAETSGAKPSARWLKGARPLLDAVGEEALRSELARWLPEIAKSQAHTDGHYEPALRDGNAELLKGLVWITTLMPDERTASCIGRLGEACFRKIPGVGAVSPKVGNACIHVLGALEGLHGVAWLARLSARVKYKEAQRLIAKALDTAAARTGQSRADLEELSLPTFGLEPSGTARIPVGERAALIRITGTADAELVWEKESGGEQKAVPAEVARDHAEELAELKTRFKDLEKLLPAQAARLERLLMTSRTWRYADFCERYLEHGLVGPLASRLLWTLESEVCGVLDGRLVDLSDRPREVSPEARIALWHPIDASVEAVRAWRGWLGRHGITQPFKQAHREIYVLTAAERATGVYSNRFAAHILRQHAFAALTRERGWAYQLQGSFDSYNVPTLVIPEHGLRVSFIAEPVANPTDIGVYDHVSTDQVSFQRGDDEARLPLDQIPPRVFSEVMRDVDLFVGVCSVGNDPTWHDGGPGERYRAYWLEVSFGELTVSAAARREVLAELVPRLSIRDRCKLVDRFLVVRGELRTYKIHLGSANILMEPNDEYLCIVPATAARKPSSGPVTLPFEGDRTLSLILSKAIMLAADRKISDPSITSQITRR